MVDLFEVTSDSYHNVREGYVSLDHMWTSVTIWKVQQVKKSGANLCLQLSQGMGGLIFSSKVILYITEPVWDSKGKDGTRPHVSHYPAG